MMIIADDRDLQLERLLFGESHGVGQRFKCQSHQYFRDGFAQGLLIDRMEILGFRHQSLPALPLFGADGGELAGHQFVDGDGTAFEVYAASDGVALVTAALEAFSARDQAPFADDDADEQDRLLDAAG